MSNQKVSSEVTNNSNKINKIKLVIFYSVLAITLIVVFALYWDPIFNTKDDSIDTIEATSSANK